ncbi:MAG: hypothetical protein WD273_12285 [Trueperaceae bacterium]
MARPRNTDALKNVFCPNKECADYGLKGGKNLKGNGKTKRGVQRYYCKTCRTSFNARTGTFANGLKTPAHVVQSALGRVADGVPPAAAARQLGLSSETVREWVKGFDPTDPFFRDWLNFLDGFERARLELLAFELRNERPPFIVESDRITEEDRRLLDELDSELQIARDHQDGSKVKK